MWQWGFVGLKTRVGSLYQESERQMEKSLNDHTRKPGYKMSEGRVRLQNRGEQRAECGQKQLSKSEYALLGSESRA